MEHLPDGQERDEAVRLVRLGAAMAAQHVGRRTGHLHNYILDIIGVLEARSVRPTFKALVHELEVAALRRDLYSESPRPVEPVERVDHEEKEIIFHDRSRGRIPVTFRTLRDHLTEAKKKLKKNNSQHRLNPESNNVEFDRCCDSRSTNLQLKRGKN